MKELKVTQDDFIAAQKLFLGRRLFTSHITGILTAVFVVSFVFWANLDPGIKLRFGGMSAVVFAALLISKPILFKRRLIGNFNRHPTLQIPTAISFDEEGMTFSSERGTIRALWGDFERFKENKKLFILLDPNLLMRILPKRAFDSEAEIAAFRAIVAARLKKG